MDAELLICIAVLHVPPGVTFAVQRGRHELLQPSRSKGGSLIFDLSVRVSERKGGGPPNVLGPYTQGKPDDRFIYLNSGTMAGQRDSCFTRRAKVKTHGITWNFTGFFFVSYLMQPGHRLRLTIGPIDSIYHEKNYNSGGVVTEESIEDARPVTVKLFHDEMHPSALCVPFGHPES
jgi:hypothetical protein